jgi:two-component system LytT family response regulator
MSFRAVIVEDEPLARSRLSHLLQPHGDINVVGQSDNVREGAEIVESQQPDILFLDIEMPQASGFDLLHAINRGLRPVVIFTTAHPEFALKGFEVSAADYLVKPFDQERLSRALERARRLLATGEHPVTPEIPRGSRRERFAVRARGEIVFVKAVNIDWISAEGNYARLHAGEVTYLVRESMQRLEETLDPALFARVHRSVIVNLDRVRKLVSTPDGSYSIVLATGASVPLGASYRGKLEQVLGQKL